MSGSNTDGSPPVRRRRLVLMLPTDPSEEELVRDWTLSEADLKEVCRCRGDGHRLRFAIQLCVLRRYGQFVSDFAAVPVRIANHLCRQLNLNQTTGHWYSMKLFEKTQAVRSERSRASGEVEEQAGRESGGLRLRSATLRPNGKGSTASEEVYQSSVVRFS